MYTRRCVDVCGKEMHMRIQKPKGACVHENTNEGMGEKKSQIVNPLKILDLYSICTELIAHAYLWSCCIHAWSHRCYCYPSNLYIYTHQDGVSSCRIYSAFSIALLIRMQHQCYGSEISIPPWNFGLIQRFKLCQQKTQFSQSTKPTTLMPSLFWLVIFLHLNCYLKDPAFQMA